VVFDKMQFRYPWRPYQQRVLQAIDDHLDDKRLHIVAAPGAGKTVLGLEVFRKLHRPTLVLSPTRIIRDQWIRRLTDFGFDGDPLALPWVSTHLAEPALLTSVTYQAVHVKAMAKGALGQTDDEEDLPEDDLPEDDMPEEVSKKFAPDAEALLDVIARGGIEVVILDEAHHLTAEWWRALKAVVSSAPELVLVSLTATPPYDSMDTSWERYTELCGPIDEEISIPELVKAGTLCPHQDYVWMVNIDRTEQQRISKFMDDVALVCRTLFEEGDFIRLVREHPMLSDPALFQRIAKRPESLIALLAFLKDKGLLDTSYDLARFDLASDDIPELTRRWWQVLLEELLTSKDIKYAAEHAEYLTRLRKHLRSVDLMAGQTVTIDRSHFIERSLSMSSSKIRACVDIHGKEWFARQDELRQVIMLDYIRDDEMVSGKKLGQLRLGAVPVFEALVASSPVPAKVGLISGRVSFLHSEVTDVLTKLGGVDDLLFEPHEAYPGYLKVSGRLNRISQVFTDALEQGLIQCLVGTRALLGEGWDAPCVNSLILATGINSFVLTNQMRGRAIRIDHQNPEKVSSIWHVVAVNQTDDELAFSDYFSLIRRFNLFAGLSERAEEIFSDFTRIETFPLKRLWQLSHAPFDVVKHNNETTQERFRKIAGVRGRWKRALDKGSKEILRPVVSADLTPDIRWLHVRNTLLSLLMLLAQTLAITASWVLSVRVPSMGILLFLLGGAILTALVWRLPETIKLLRIGLFHLPVGGSLKQIGEAVASSLSEVGYIETSKKSLFVERIKHADGTYFVGMLGGTFYESSMFSDALAEVISPIDSPRYLIRRKGSHGRSDYHAVPLKLALNKGSAEVFLKHWERYVGPAELIYTRTGEGRDILAKSRLKAFSSAFAREVRREDQWL